MNHDAEFAQQCINTIRFLSVDAVQQANSGHPGTPMALAGAGYVLWQRHLRHNPANPHWAGRDRFVLSCGHASMLLYSLLHLTGYDLPLEELINFRQLHSRTPGHPEYGLTPGVETTTGPLGQGFANGVGFAIATAWLAARFNRPGQEIIDHTIYAFCSDGDLQEGISSEAASLAGHLKLGRLVYLYDDNNIQIEGSTDFTFSEDVAARFSAYGWHVQGALDGFDLQAVDAALTAAREETQRPSLIICKTIIGIGAPQQNTGEAHGAPLGEDGVKAAKEYWHWPQEPKFYVPEAVKAWAEESRQRGQAWEQEWQERMAAYAIACPAEAAELARLLAGELPEGWDSELDSLFPVGSKPLATRSASEKALNSIAGRLPELIGGSADLAPSTKTLVKGGGDFEAGSYGSRNFHFGVREHAMGAIVNGMALHGGVIPYSATFLQFSDYMRPAIRLGALSGIGSIYVFSHDSIGLGEDGPTHQPVEHLMALRLIPNIMLIRPGDAHETAEAWRIAVRHRSGPVIIVLCRQNIPVFDRTPEDAYPEQDYGGALCAGAHGLHQGAYVLWQAQVGTPDCILIGTGSEVQFALEAGRRLAGEGVNARVVSMPSFELFDRQDAAYRESVLPPAVTARVAVEAGSRIGWERYVGSSWNVVGLDGFGASAPAEELYRHFGITADNVAWLAREAMQRS
jgi:transketolase